MFDLIDSDDVFDQLESIFFETAHENLDAATLNLIVSKQQHLSMEIHEYIDDSWAELVFDKLDQNEWLEAALYVDVEGKQKCLALFLLNTDMEDEKECHIQWLP